jgi:MFS family permease
MLSTGVVIVSLTVMLACAATLFVLSYHLAPGTRVWPIYAVIALSGVARSFMTPSRAALAAELVPRELYPRASAWRSAAWQLAAVVARSRAPLRFWKRAARVRRPALLHLIGVVCAGRCTER